VIGSSAAGFAGTGSATERVELHHHRVPYCLLKLRDSAETGALDGAVLQAWLDYEHEALRWGVNSDVSRDELAALICATLEAIPYEDYRDIHSEDFARWGRRGGLATLERYGRAWFVALRLRRHGRITRSQLEASALELAGSLP
jgi:hypothetical protein